MLCGVTLVGQTLTVNPAPTPTQMAEELVGQGVQINNAVVSGLPEQYAIYDSDNTELGTSAGILLSSGRAINALGPNDESGLCTVDGANGCIDGDLYDLGGSGDTDLSFLIGGNTWDAAVFEFDITVQGDSLRFDFVFGSEEYLEWVGSSFNDVFGFFISGPGITGTQNLAVLPNSNTPVSVNSVNLVDNPQYFYDNQNPLGQGVQYDGFTQGLTAEIGDLIPCETYHLKLAVADGTDRLYDTGVFISKIESNPVTILTSTAAGIDYMIEGCNDGSVTLQTTFVPTEDLEVLFTLEGTAGLGTDYITVPDLTPFFDAGLGAYVITVPAGQTTFSFDIIPLADGIIDGGEFVTINLVEQLCDGLNFDSSVDFIIEDTFLVNVQPPQIDVCFGQCVDVTSTISDANAATFEWSPTEGLSDPTSLNPTICPADDQTYTLTATLGNCVSDDSIVINVDSLNLEINLDPVTCVNGNNGFIDLEILNGVEPFTYDWTGPNGTSFDVQDLTGVPEGEYCVVVTDATGCQGSACVTVEEVDVLTLESAVLSDYLCEEISCNGAADGSVDITVSGGSGGYQYSWTSDLGFTAATEDVTGLPAATYTVVVTDITGCQVSGSFVLDEPDPLDIELVGQVDVLCTGENTGSATVTSTGGCPPYFYSWSHDPTLQTPVALDLGSQSYTVTVSDINGCTSSDAVTIVIGEPSDPLEVVVESIALYPGGFNVSCPGASDGNVDVTIQGGIGAYSILWTDSEGLFVTNTEDLFDVPCGVYTLTVQDENGCEVIQTFDLSCVPPIAIETAIVLNPCGDPTAGIGEIEITNVTGGNGAPYTLNWTSGPSCPCTGNLLTGLESGVYVLEVIDGQGCTETFPITVGTQTAFTAIANVIEPQCAGDSTGSIDFTVLPPSNYTFTWNGPDGPLPATEDQFNLPAGTYTVNISDGICDETQTIVIGEPDAIAIDFINVVPPSCFGVNDGSLEAQFSGGTGGLMFEWLPATDPLCFFDGSTDPAISNLFECDYVAQVTDGNGCVATESIFLDAPVIMDIFVEVTLFDGGFNVSCNGENDGAISVTVSGGSPDPIAFDPYDYLYDWTNGDDVTQYGNDPNSNFVDNLGAGSYQVDVFDANGCLATTTIPIVEPDPIAPAGATSDYNGFGVSCFGATDGFITPNIAGGSGNYNTYVWSADDLYGNDPNATDLINLGPGVYCLDIVDSNGCAEQICFTLTEPEPVVASLDNVTDATCFGYCDGTLSASATGGTGSYSFSWVDGDGVPYAGNVLTGLCAGTYTGTISDGNGCMAILNADIEQPETFTVALTVPSQTEGPFDLACVGDDNGSIESTVVGGIGNLDYSWSECGGGFLGNGTTLTNLEAGCYELVITDEDGCQATANTTITEPTDPLVVTSAVSLFPNGFNISCFGADDGSIDLDITGGVPNYTTVWQLNGDGVIYSEDEDLFDLAGGIYDVLVTDANGCDTTLFITLNEPPAISPNVVLSDYNGFNVSCFDACDGTIDISPSGGIGTLDISWTDFGNETSLTDLCAGSYTLSITDDENCELITVVNLLAPDEWTFEPLVADVTCNGGTDGSILSNPVGSFDLADVTYTWTPDVSNGPDATDLGAGTYDLTITDPNGCTADLSGEVLEPSVISINTISTPASCGECDGTLNAIASGGTGSLSLEWTPQIDDLSMVCPGVYTITATDANDCTITDDVTVEGPPPVTADASISNNPCFGDCVGTIALDLNNVQEPATYLWTDANGDPVADTEDLGDLCSGTYSLEISHGADCIDSFDYTITEPPALALEIELSVYDFETNISTFGGSDGSIDLFVDGGVPEYDAAWNGPAQIDDDDFSPDDLPAGDYALLITDAQGCVIDTIITLTEPFDLTLPTGLSPNGDGNNDTYIILGVELHPTNTFQVFNRWGNLVYDRANYQNEWDGTNNDGETLADGTYYVIFLADDREFQTYVDLRR